MTCWNRVTDWFRWTGVKVYSWYEFAQGWFDSCVGSWYIHPDGIFPLPHPYRYGLNVNDIWRYEPETGKLIYGDSSEKRQRVSWLSARVKRGTQEAKDMDRFLADLHVYPNGQDLPFSVFLQAWSIYDRQWWTADSSVQIEWIDPMAEEHTAVVTEAPYVPLLSCVKPLV